VVPTPTAPSPGAVTGYCTLRVTPTGVFTGSLIVGGLKPLKLTGSINAAGNAFFGRLKTSTISPNPTAADPLKFSFQIGVNASFLAVFTGTLEDSTGTLATLEAEESLYTASRRPVPPFIPVPVTLRNPLTDAGRYTGAFPALTPAAQALPAAAFPQGAGYAKITLSAAGAVRFVGKLADGTPLMSSGVLSKSNVLPFFVRLYATRGLLAGPIAFRDQATTDADSATLRWFRPVMTTGNYVAGWPDGIGVPFVASKFLAKRYTPGLTILGVAPTTIAPNANFALLHPALAGDSLKNPLLIGSTNVVTVQSPGIGETSAMNLVLKLPATGLVNGTFGDPVTLKATSLLGIVLQKSNSVLGYSLVADLAAPSSSTRKVSAPFSVSP
jgi:hypothetical protein